MTTAMPETNFARTARKQKAVVWDKTGTDSYGQPTLGSPREIRVRWSQEQQQGMNAEGQVIAISATVIVGEAILIGSEMWLGYLVDLPEDPVQRMRVVSYDETPDIEGHTVTRSVSLSRLRER